MAPKNSKNSPEEGVPAEVIAQAEAAIYGNIEDPNDEPDARRRPSIAQQSSGGSQATTVQQPEVGESERQGRPGAHRRPTYK